MIDQTQVQTLLQIHGLSESSPLGQIEAVLLGAKYSDEEVTTVLNYMKMNPGLRTTRAEALNKINRTDLSLKPAEISALLGIEVTVDRREYQAHRERGMTMSQTIGVLALTLFLGIVGLLVAMYAHEIGPFHPTVSAFGK